MNKLLEKYLIKTYPKIFVDMYGPMDKTCLHWGIETGDGWWFLLNNLCSKIQTHIDDPPWVLKDDDSGNHYEKPKKQVCPQVVALQIKEKFGSLRFYYSGGDEYIRGMIDFAESLSYNICENCGRFNEDVGRTQGWIQSLCTTCATEYGKELKYNDKMIFLWEKVVAMRTNPARSWKSLSEVTLDDVKELKKTLQKQRNKQRKERNDYGNRRLNVAMSLLFQDALYC